MSHKFLKTREDMLADYAAMGRDQKAGKAIDERHYRDLGQWLKGSVTVQKHARWWQVYEETFSDSYEEYVSHGMKEQRAKKQAHLQGKRAVMKLSGKSEQHVQRVIKYWDTIDKHKD